MALLTFTKRNYESEQDFERLIHYLYDPAKLACASSNLLYYQYPEILCTQWCYCHPNVRLVRSGNLLKDKDHNKTYEIVNDKFIYSRYLREDNFRHIEDSADLLDRADSFSQTD